MAEMYGPPRCQCPEVGVPCPACDTAGPRARGVRTRRALAPDPPPGEGVLCLGCMTMFLPTPQQRGILTKGQLAWCSAACGRRWHDARTSATRAARRREARRRH
jgi:hypothetical protein